MKVMENRHMVDKKQIAVLIGKLKQSFQVIAPLKSDGEVVFKNVDNPNDVIFDYEISYMSPKEFFLPPEEQLFAEENNETKIAKPESKPILIFGLKEDDLEAITYLDEIMSKPAEDFYYWQRRKSSVLVGISEKEFQAAPKCDLLLKKKDENNYFIFSFSEKGRNIAESIKSNSRGKNSSPDESGELFFGKEKKNTLKKALIDSELLADAVSWSRNHKIWDELAKICLGCGICTYVCPLCYCFFMEDSVSLDGKKCVKCRKWDACTLPGFSQIAGGHNFRPTIKERYYNWYYHKFVRAYKEYGRSQCVGCGRCQKYCPAEIDIEKVLLEILEDYKNNADTQM
jgi:ferredoxin